MGSAQGDREETILAKKASKKNKPIYLLAAAAIVILGELFNIFFGFGGMTAPLKAETSVHFIDVGQGDAELILSGGEAVLIDAGPTAAGDTVVAYLKQQGVTKLRAAIATHPHEDHIGGMDKVLKAFPTEVLLLPDKTATTRCYERMLDADETTGAKVVVPKVDERIFFDSGAQLTFLSPSPEAVYSNTNNYSIVSLLSAGGKNVLFMGDAETEIEEALLRQGTDIRCDVLKVGHHGSSTSSSPDFVERAAPSIAVISCAKDNDYGHPHRETIELLNRLGIETHITADEGTYVYEIPAAS